MSVRLFTQAMARRWVIRAFAVAVLLAGVWRVGVFPLKREVLASEAELAAQAIEIANYHAVTAVRREPPDAAIAALQDRLDRISELSRRSGDASVFYESAGRLAEDCNVRIERIEPHATGGAAVGKTGVKVDVSGFSIEVAGEFAGVLNFLGRLEGVGGISKITGVRVARVEYADATPRVSCVIDASTFRVVESDADKSVRVGDAGGTRSGT